MNESIADRLRLKVPALKVVGAAADVAAVGASPALPAAYVLTISERAGRNTAAAGATVQTVAITFGILIGVANASARGARHLEDVASVKTAIRAALHGWTPEGCDDGLELDGGEVLSFDNRVLWWMDRHRTTYQLRTT